MDKLPNFLKSRKSPVAAVPDAAGKDDSAPTPLDADPGRPARFGLWALAIGFGGFLLWAGLAPLDEGVPSPGMVSINTKRKAVQHPTGGIVKEVLVMEGDRVKEGQAVIRLDEAAARAQYENSRQQYYTLRANQSRLQAEQVGMDKLSWHADLVKGSSDPLIKVQMQTQELLFQSRRSSLRADLQAFEENIRGQQALIVSYKEILVGRKNQLALLNEELGHTRELVKEGYIPRNRELELQRMISDINGGIAEVLGNSARAQNAIGELRQRAVGRQQEYRKEVDGQLSDVSRQVQAEEARFRATSDDLNRIEIRSPAAGQVVGLAVQTVGGVIQPAQKLMDIVPENELLMVETKVAPNLIDRVHAGLPVDIRFSSFANSPALVVDGKLASISGDLLQDPQNGAQYYLARVVVTPEGYKRLGKRTLQAGMPVEVVLKTGERTLLTYILHPLMKRLAASLKEE